MPISIVANTSANYAQSGMRTRNEAILDNTQRLSSGLRVFSAREDAAALAVGTSLRIENSVLKTAALNASSGVSALQIADGALGQISDLSIRMLSLAQTASSGHMDDPTRLLMDAEFQQLKQEVDRIASNVQFSGVNLLAGSSSFLTETGNISATHGITDVYFNQDQVAGGEVYRYAYNATTEVLSLTRIDGTSASTQNVDLTALLDNIAGSGQNLGATEQLDVSFSQLGVTLSLGSGFDRGVDIAASAALTTGADITVATPVYTAAATNVALDALNGLQDLATGYDHDTGALSLVLDTDGTEVRLAGVAGISYRVNGGTQTASGAASDDIVGAGPNTIEVYVDMPGGGTELLGTWATGAVATTGTTDGALEVNLGTGLIGAEFVDANGPTRLTYKVGTGVESGLDVLYTDIPAATLSALGLSTASILTGASATVTVAAIQTAMTTINQARATVGAQQLRLEQVGQNLAVMGENNERARSALLDVDVAKEITDFTSNQAMLEAGAAMLARANTMPDLLIELLKSS